MDCLKDDNVEDILLRLPSWASLGHAVRASHRFCHIASSPDFLRRFRARHASSSPRSLLGVFVHRHSVGFPVFHLAGPARSDPGLVAVARTGDFLLAGLEDDPGWRFHDCRNGRLLLSKGTTLTIYDPISLRRTDISRPPDDPFPDAYISTINCLLDDGGAPFRVVSLQVNDRRRLRAVEYDSRVQEWRFHPWAAIMAPPLAYQTTMCAAGLIFWNNDACRPAGTSSILLDTRTMEFTMLRLPATIVDPHGGRIRRYSIGETDDGKCCLVCVSNRMMQVWLLRENRGRKWEFEKETPLSGLLAERCCTTHHVGKVAAGLVIVWAGNAGSFNSFQHYVIDLKNLSLKAIFSDIGTITACPFQLRWPPAGLTPTKRHMFQIDTRKGMYL
jgi:hypothetical protein